MFKTEKMNVDVETTGELTRGETVCDYYELTGKPQNTEVMLGINRQRFIELIMEALHSFDWLLIELGLAKAGPSFIFFLKKYKSAVQTNEAFSQSWS